MVLNIKTHVLYIYILGSIDKVKDCIDVPLLCHGYGLKSNNVTSVAIQDASIFQTKIFCFFNLGFKSLYCMNVNASLYLGYKMYI